MPWFPIKGIVRKLRMERRWTRKELAKKSGVKLRTIRLWESNALPRTGQDDTVRGLAAAFDLPPEKIADWLAYDPAAADDLEESAGGAPPKSTLALRASRDDLREWITSPAGERLEVMRPRLLHRISTAPGLAAQTKFAMIGKVKDHRDMPTIVGSVLGVDAKVCGQFYLIRKVHNGDPFYASPFSSCAEQTARLLDAAESRALVTMIVRIEIREPTKDRDFRGFVGFQKKGEKPKFWKWCFVVETVLDGEISISFGDSDVSLEKIGIAPSLTGRAQMPRSRSRRRTATAE